MTFLLRIRLIKVNSVNYIAYFKEITLSEFSVLNFHNPSTHYHIQLIILQYNNKQAFSI